MEIQGICRCCLTEGLHKDMDYAYTFSNQKEIYSEMLMECFNFVMTPTPNMVNIICDKCINSLRTCIDFKRQVLESDKEFFKKCFKSQCAEDEFKIKIEPLQDDEFSDSDDRFLSETVTALSSEIKSENEFVATEKRTVIKKKTKNGGKKSNKGTDEWKSSSLKTIVSRLASVNCKIKPIKKSQPKELSTLKITWHKNSTKQKNNLTNILKYSNVLPFKNKSLIGFECLYCTKSYTDPTELRTHTEKEHKDDKYKLNPRYYTESCLKVDITDLKCSLCGENEKSIAQLKTHLSDAHKKLFHQDINDNLIEFILRPGDIYDCAMCTSTYETFKMLKQHMNTHYCNFSCNNCDATFATKRSLTAHKSTHLDETHKCDYCDKIFATKYKKCYHIRKLHLGERSISNCPYCNETFRSYYQRNQHLIKVHNTKSQYKCNICDREFVLKSLLMYHIKKTHLMERNAQCTECGYRFFSKKALKAHMVKHTGEKNYSCDVCHKSYARKYTLREHMRIHNNDRRFKCNVCGTAFVQKCSLKSHLLSNHGISLAACEITSSLNSDV